MESEHQQTKEQAKALMGQLADFLDDVKLACEEKSPIYEAATRLEMQLGIDSLDALLNIKFSDQPQTRETWCQEFNRRLRAKLTPELNTGTAMDLMILVSETLGEMLVEAGARLQPLAPLETQLLRHFRSMTDLQRQSLLVVLERAPEVHRGKRRARLGHAELTDEQQLLVELYARSEPQAREGVLKVLRGTAKKAADVGRSPSLHPSACDTTNDDHRLHDQTTTRTA